MNTVRNPERMKKLVTDLYKPKYQAFLTLETTKSMCAKIVEEEFKRVTSPLDTAMLQVTRGARTRMHEFLQSQAPTPDPVLQSTNNAVEMRNQLDMHHEHQTAHFQALWELTDALVDEAMKKKVSS